MEIKYDIPIEVTKKQYQRIIKKFSQIIAHRIDDDDGRYWIKLWAMEFKDELEKELTN